MNRAWWLLLIPFAGLVWWLYGVRSAPPEVPFAKIGTETIVETVVTNGKAEPVEWAAVRAEREGILAKLAAENGKTVAKGGVLAELDSAEARIALTSAEARLAQAAAELDALDRGGRPSEITEIEGSISRAKIDLDTARKDYESLKRLVEKNAATMQEVRLAAVRVEQLETQIRSLQSKRAALVAPSDKAVAEAKVRDARTAVEAAKQRLELSLIRSPISGTIYHVEPRAGAYLRPGDLLANIGRLEKLRILVYIDEPDLGRVSVGMPVTITWDAKPERKWNGVVEKAATQITTLGTRQVGEVVCLINNPDRELAPGANINASIRSRVAENATALPKECLRREGEVNGIYVLEGNRIAWRAVKTGISSVTRVQVLEGAKPGDLVALPVERPLSRGMEVRPVVR